MEMQPGLPPWRAEISVIKIRGFNFLHNYVNRTRVEKIVPVTEILVVIQLTGFHLKSSEERFNVFN